VKRAGKASLNVVPGINFAEEHGGYGAEEDPSRAWRGSAASLQESARAEEDDEEEEEEDGPEMTRCVPSFSSSESRY
jgi:hypothetical protein